MQQYRNNLQRYQNKSSPKRHSSSIKLPKINKLSSKGNIAENNNDRNINHKKQISINRYPLYTEDTQSQQDPARRIKNSLSMKLQPIIKERQYSMNIIQQTQIVKNNNRSKINIDKKSNSSKSKEYMKIVGNTTNASSEVNSNISINQYLNHLNNLIPVQRKKQLITSKIQERNLGKVSPIWWYLTDILLLSIQNSIKKKLYHQYLSTAYACIQLQILSNQQCVIQSFQDQKHIALIIQYFYYEKVYAFILRTIKNWGIQLQLLNWCMLAIKNIMQNRKLILDIVVQTVENNIQDNKIKKPRYIGREKKLIQISKFNAMLKETFRSSFEKVPQQYDIFKGPLPQNLESLKKMEMNWRQKIFKIPSQPYYRPYNPIKPIIVIEPEQFLYRYSSKLQIFYLRPNTENFLKKLSDIYLIIIFTSNTTFITQNFIKNLQEVKIEKIFDKQYITYKQGNPIKNLDKLCNNYKNIVVLDHNQQYYQYHKDKIFQINIYWKKEQYLLNLADQLINLQFINN